MDRNEADLMVALDPADGRDVVALVTHNPAIAMAPLNPASGVTHRPVPSRRGRPYATIDDARGACYRISGNPIANCRWEARKVVLHVGRAKGIGKAYLSLHPTEPGGGMKIGPHQMRPWCKSRHGARPGLRNFIVGKLPAVMRRGLGRRLNLRFPAGPIGSAVKESSLPLQFRQSGNKSSKPGSFHHFLVRRGPLSDPLRDPLVPIRKR